MKPRTALKLAIAALQKEARKQHGIGHPYRMGQITEQGTEYHRAAERYIELNKAIEILDAMVRQKRLL